MTMIDYEYRNAQSKHCIIGDILEALSKVLRRSQMRHGCGYVWVSEEGAKAAEAIGMKVLFFEGSYESQEPDKWMLYISEEAYQKELDERNRCEEWLESLGKEGTER